MPPVPVFPPYYLGAVLCGGLAVYVRWWTRREERRGIVLRMGRSLTALFVGLLVLTGIFGALTIGEAIEANTWVYNYYFGVEHADLGAQAVVLPIPKDTTLLANLQANRSSANWSYVTTVHGPGLYVAFSGPVSLDAHVRVLAPFGSHPDGDVPLQEGNGSLWQVWIEYLGTGSIDVNFQYGYGYTINGALVYIGTLTPGWASYGLIPAP